MVLILRIGSFPPKNAKVRVDEEKLPSISTTASAFFPSAVLARSEIWNEDVRRPLRRPMFQKKDIDKRRAEVSDYSIKLLCLTIIVLCLAPCTRETVASISAR